MITASLLRQEGKEVWYRKHVFNGKDSETTSGFQKAPMNYNTGSPLGLCIINVYYLTISVTSISVPSTILIKSYN